MTPNERFNSTLEKFNLLLQNNFMLSEIAKDYINNIDNGFQRNNFEIIEKLDYSVLFSFFGYKFIVKAETFIDNQLANFKEGELCTYIIIEENEKEKEYPLFSYFFDTRGNMHDDIENFISIQSLYVNYLPTFFENLLEYSKKQEIPLKFNLGIVWGLKDGHFNR